MNILVNALVTPPKTVGVGNYILQLLRYLSETRDDVHLFVLCDRDFAKLLPTHTPRITPVITGFGYHPRWKSLPYSILWQQLKLRKVISKYRIDLYLMPNTSWLPELSIPAIITVHDLLEVDNAAYPLSKRLYRKWLLNRIYRKSLRIITVSEFSADRIRSYFGSDVSVSVISPFIKYEVAVDSIKPDNSNSQEHFTILYIGNERPYKGAACVLKAFVEIAVSNPDVQIILCGSIDHNFLKSHITDANLRKRVKLTGFIAEDKLPELYRSASVYVSGSEYEGFGLPVLEAMSFKLPVILPNIPVFIEVAGDAALFYNSGDSNDLARKLSSLVGNRDLLTTCSNKSVLQRKLFDNRKNAQHLLSVFEELVTSKDR